MADRSARTDRSATAEGRKDSQAPATGPIHGEVAPIEGEDQARGRPQPELSDPLPSRNCPTLRLRRLDAWGP